MTTLSQSGAKYASNNQHKRSYTYATQQEKQTMEISINKLIVKYKKCITNMNRVLTNEPSGSDALTKEFNSIDPNTNALYNIITDIEIEASHSMFDGQPTAALAVLRTLRTQAA